MENNQFTFSLSPMKTFAAGIVLGIMALCTIGFFVLLGMGVDSDMDDAPAAPTAAAQPAPRAAQPAQPVQVTVDPIDEKTDHIWGNKNAKVTLVEYSDFECPYCARLFPTIERVKAEYKNKVRIVYRHFPLSFHANAKKLAYASECAAEKGKFWEMHDEIFKALGTGNKDWSDAKLEGFAKTIGINVPAFKTCLASDKYVQKVQNHIQSGSRAGVRGTPHTIVMTEDGKTIPLSGAQPFESFKATIDPLLR